MRAQRSGFQAFPEARSRSRHKSRKRQFHKEKQHPDGDGRYGVQLQRAVSERLTWLGIAHVRYKNHHPVARAERIELAIETPLRRTPRIKVQYTLRHGTRPKIADFLIAALTGHDQDVPRVYLEIDAPRGMQVKDLAERVAYVIRKIVQDIRDLPRQIGNVVGLALDATRKNWRDALTPLPLIAMLDDGARAAVAAGVQAVLKIRAAAAAAKRAKAAAAGPFYRVFETLHGLRRAFTPHPTPVYAASHIRYPIRQPR